MRTATHPMARSCGLLWSTSSKQHFPFWWRKVVQRCSGIDDFACEYWRQTRTNHEDAQLGEENPDHALCYGITVGSVKRCSKPHAALMAKNSFDAQSQSLRTCLHTLPVCILLHA